MTQEIIIDCGLNLRGGHHLSHLRAVLSALRRAGRKVDSILSNRSVGRHDIDGTQVEPLFDSTGYERFATTDLHDTTDGLARSRAAQEIALKLLLRDRQLGRASTIRVLNATVVTVTAVALWLAWRGSPFGGGLKIYMLDSAGLILRSFGRSVRLIEYDPVRHRSTRRAFAMIGRDAPRLAVYASSPTKRIVLSKVIDGYVHGYAIHTDAVPLDISKRKATATVLLYAGDAKYGKGLTRVATVLKALETAAEKQAISVDIKIHVNDANNRFMSVLQDILEAASARLKITILLGNISPEDYRMHMTEANLVILLHLADYYFDMESGFAFECLQSKTPFFCRNGTLMARELRFYGGESLCYDNEEDLVSSAMDALTDMRPVETLMGGVSEAWIRAAGALEAI